MLFVSNIGSEYFIGFVGSGVVGGIVVVVFEWGVRFLKIYIRWIDFKNDY